MNKVIILLVIFVSSVLFGYESNKQNYPIGEPGLTLTYSSKVNNLPKSVVSRFQIVVGAIEEVNGQQYQWIKIDEEKNNKQKFTVWVLGSSYPSEDITTAKQDILRYILIEGGKEPIEYTHKNLGTSILPSTGAWPYLFPHSEENENVVKSLAKNVKLLGHEYQLDKSFKSKIPQTPQKTRVISLLPEVLIGIPHNTKLKDETRKYDDSEYEYIHLTKDNFREMIDAGINCFRVNADEASWLEKENVYYWGIGGKDVNYPECLYKSNYIGPALFFDEPMVGTRDLVIRPRLREDPKFRKDITPAIAFEEFKKVFHKKKYKEGPTRLLKGLAQREDVDLGDMQFLQQNMYTWETMVSSASYQLSEGNSSPPYAIVFEPPGRFGSKRVLPELNMCFDCQIPIDNPKNVTGIIYGFLRGAARVTDKDWGMSIYGQVDRADAFWFMTHAYDQGASLFFYWDNHRLAAVPYNEYLAISKNLSEHAKNFPNRDMEKLKRAAEVAIMLPPYYNLGHVKMGLGLITGVPELNLERKNSYGIKYREVMNNFFVEIERCIRLGVEYDLFWNLENLELNGYREIVVIREDGKVEVTKNRMTKIFDSARKPVRPDGIPPKLSAEVKIINDKVPYEVVAKAEVTEGSAPIYYTMGADSSGIYNNQYVLWEMFGPNEEDYTDFWFDRWNVSITEHDNSTTVEIKFKVNEPGSYHLRVATTDVAGRSAVVWKEINIHE